MRLQNSTAPGSGRDSSYGRLLRRLDLAMDMASTRQWLEGQPTAPGELEIKGLSEADLHLLRRILEGLTSQQAASPEVLAALAEAQQQNRTH